MNPVRISFLRALCLLCFFVLSQHRSPAQRINLPPVTRGTLKNGIRVVLMEYHRAPTISVIAVFPGGDSVDAPGKAGTASMAAELLRKGTEKRSAVQLAEQIDFLGGSLAAGTNDDRLSVSLDVLSKDTDAGLDLFADVIRHPTFPAEEMERQRQLEMAALQALPEDPGAVASRAASEVVYGGHPYGRAPTMTSVKAIARDDAQAYYRQFVVPNRMILVAVGDFKTGDILGRLRSRFEDWPRGQNSLPPIPPVTPSPRKMVLIDKPDATQAQLRFIRTGIKRLSPDYFPAQVADTILGGGFTSRLVDEIRVNRGLTYGISSAFGEQLHGGSFGVSTFTKIETTRLLIDAVQAVLRRTARSGVTPAELTKVKNYMSGLYAIHVQTPEALAGELAAMAFYGLPDNYLESYPARIRGVSLAQVNRIARTYFAPETHSIVLVAPAKAVRAQLGTFGSFEVRPVDSVAK